MKLYVKWWQVCKHWCRVGWMERWHVSEGNGGRRHCLVAERWRVSPTRGVSESNVQSLTQSVDVYHFFEFAYKIIFYPITGRELVSIDCDPCHLMHHKFWRQTTDLRQRRLKRVTEKAIALVSNKDKQSRHTSVVSWFVASPTPRKQKGGIWLPYQPQMGCRRTKRLPSKYIIWW